MYAYGMYLNKLCSEFEWWVFEAQVIAWWTSQDESKVNMHYVAFRIKKNVPIVSKETHICQKCAKVKTGDGYLSFTWMK